MMTRTMMHSDDPERRFFSREDCEQLSQQVIAMARGGGRTFVNIHSQWDANLNWSRNSISMMGDQRAAAVTVVRRVNGARGVAITNQIDVHSLQAATEAAETIARQLKSRPPEVETRYSGEAPLTPFIWDEATAQQSGLQRGELAGRIIEQAMKQGIVTAGFLQTGVRTMAAMDSREPTLQYMARTVTQFSTTMRDWKQKGSGWAGRSSYAWSRIDPEAIAATAIDKCIQSRNPVAVEPGRYMTILEPQATGQVVRGIINLGGLLRNKHEDKRGFWYDRHVEETYGEDTVVYDKSKIGQRVLDPKVTVRQLPMHPDLGTWPYLRYDDPYREVTWIKNGVLMNLWWERDDVSDKLNRAGGLMFNDTVAMDGGDSSIEEMIATTKRGILVTRFSLGPNEFLRGDVYTRDGLWLIENGKISKAIKNFRARPAPLFVLNDVLMVGPAVPIFSPENPIVVPPVKVREVDFVSLADAV